MASPFELLESYVKISERGLTTTMNQLRSLRALALQVTRPVYTVRIATSGNLNAGQLNAQLSSLRTNFQNLNSLQVSGRVNAIISQLGQQSQAAAVQIRRLNDELFILSQLLPVLRRSQFSFNVNFGSGRGSLTTQLQTVRDLRTALLSLQSVGGLSAFSQFAAISQLGFAIRSLFEAFREVQRLREFAATTQNAAAAMRASAAAAQLFGRAMFGIVGSVAAAVAGLSAFGTVAQAQREVLAAQLQALTGSATAVADIFNDLRGFSLRFGIGFEQLAGTAKQLAAFEFELRDIIPLTQALGIASQVTGQDLTRFIFALTQVREAGALTGEELRQLRNSGLPIVSELAKNLKVPVSEIAKLTERRQISFDDLRQAVLSLTGPTTDIGKAAEAMSQTTIGALKRTGVAFKELSQAVGVNAAARETANFFAFVTAEAAQLARQLRGLPPARFITDDDLKRIEELNFQRQFGNVLQKTTADQDKRIEQIRKDALTDTEKHLELLQEIDKLRREQPGGILVEGGFSLQEAQRLRNIFQDVFDDKQAKALRQEQERLNNLVDEMARLEREITDARQRRLGSGLKISQPEVEAAREALRDLLEAEDAGLPAAQLQAGVDNVRRKLIQATLEAKKLRKELQPNEALLRGTEAEFNFRIKDTQTQQRQLTVLEDLRRIEADSNRKTDVLIEEVRKQREREALEIQEAVLDSIL